MKTFKLKVPNTHIATQIELLEQIKESRELTPYEQDDLNTLDFALTLGCEGIHGDTMTFVTSEQLARLENNK